MKKIYDYYETNIYIYCLFHLFELELQYELLRFLSLRSSRISNQR